MKKEYNILLSLWVIFSQNPSRFFMLIIPREMKFMTQWKYPSIYYYILYALCVWFILCTFRFQFRKVILIALCCFAFSRWVSQDFNNIFTRKSWPDTHWLVFPPIVMKGEKKGYWVEFMDLIIYVDFDSLFFIIIIMIRIDLFQVSADFSFHFHSAHSSPFRSTWYYYMCCKQCRERKIYLKCRTKGTMCVCVCFLRKGKLVQEKSRVNGKS